MKGFCTEMLFAYIADDGTQCLGWYHGTVKKILNEKTRRIRVEWDQECLGEDGICISDHKISKGNWNPKTAKRGNGENI